MTKINKLIAINIVKEIDKSYVDLDVFAEQTTVSLSSLYNYRKGATSPNKINAAKIITVCREQYPNIYTKVMESLIEQGIVNEVDNG